MALAGLRRPCPVGNRRFRRRGQVAIKVEHAGLQIESQALDRAGTVEAAGCLGLQRLAFDGRLGERHPGPLAREGGVDLERPRVRLAGGERPIEPGGQRADRGDREIEGAVQVRYRLLAQAAVVDELDLGGFERCADRGAVAG